mgnify:CR=1 FL=1
MKTYSLRSFWHYTDRESFGEDYKLTGYSSRYTPDTPDDDSDLFASSDDIREYAGNSALSGIERAAIILLRERASL